MMLEADRNSTNSGSQAQVFHDIFISEETGVLELCSLASVASVPLSVCNDVFTVIYSIVSRQKYVNYS